MADGNIPTTMGGKPSRKTNTTTTTVSDGNKTRGIDDFEVEAMSADNNAGVISGMTDFASKWNTTGSATGETEKNREQLWEQEAKSFNPKILGPWKDNSPEAQEQREETKAAGKAYRGKFAQMMDKRRAAMQEGLEKAKEERNRVKEESKKSASERMEAAAEEANEAERVRLQDKVAEYQDKAAKAYDKGDNFAFQWYVNQIPKLKEQLVTEKYKKIPTKADVLDLSKDERKAIMNAEKDVLKSQFKAIKELTESDEYKGDKNELKKLGKAYRQGIKETTKRDVPYAIRNAFLIIDMIQKSLQNIGRALPKGSLNPAYTQTPMEEPELFKLWREQIEGGQKRTQTAEEGLSETAKENIKGKYTVPRSLIEEAGKRVWKWDDLVKNLKLKGLEKKVTLDQQRELEKYAANGMDDESLKNAALFAAYQQAGQGELAKAHRNKWLADNYKDRHDIVGYLKGGGILKQMTVNTLEEVAKGLDKSLIGGVASPAVKSISAALKALPNFDKMSDDEILDWMYSFEGPVDDIKAFWDNLFNATNRDEFDKAEKELDKAAKEESDQLQLLNAALEQKSLLEAELKEINSQIEGLPNGRKKNKLIQEKTLILGDIDSFDSQISTLQIEYQKAKALRIQRAKALQNTIIPQANPEA